MKHELTQGPQMQPLQKTQKIGQATVDTEQHLIDYHRPFIAS